jgi:hypothetical protein
MRSALVSAILGSLAAFAQAPPLPAIVSISICAPNGPSGGSCPVGSFDTHQIVLAPDGSGAAINTYGAGTASDEHSSVFPPGSLGSNRDYLFVVASGTPASPEIGALFLSGGSGPGKNGQWTFDFPITDAYGSYRSGFGHVFVAPLAGGHCPAVADGNPAHQDPTFDLNYAAPGSVVLDPTAPPGSLLMIYEGVNACAGDNGGGKSGNGNGYISASVATSLDYGKTWPTYRGTPAFSFVPLPDVSKTQGPNASAGALGKSVCMGNDCTSTPPAAYGRYPVLTPPVSLTTAMATGQSLPSTMADTEPAAFLDDGAGAAAPYVYLVHGYIPGGLGDPPLPDSRNSDLVLARAQLNGGAAPLQFFKWDGKRRRKSDPARCPFSELRCTGPGQEPGVDRLRRRHPPIPPHFRLQFPGRPGGWPEHRQVRFRLVLFHQLRHSRSQPMERAARNHRLLERVG